MYNSFATSFIDHDDYISDIVLRSAHLKNDAVYGVNLHCIFNMAGWSDFNALCNVWGWLINPNNGKSYEKK